MSSSIPQAQDKHAPPVHEPPWPAIFALLAAAILSWGLPETWTPGPRWIAVPLVAIFTAATVLFPRFHNPAGYAAVTVVTVELAGALLALLRDLLSHRGRAVDLLQGALIIWSMNILVFACWYWRLDSGGPHRRARHEVYGGGSFLFPQLSLPPEIRKSIGAQHWRPRFIDYLFLAFNTSTAFSPTDAPVLSGWAKAMMMIQASISLTTLAVVAARAVNIL